MNGLGVSGATEGTAPADEPGDDVAPIAAAPLPTAATAVRQGADSFAELLARHCSAALPPGWTPEQCAMKSDRQAERIAAACSVVGPAGADADVPADVALVSAAPPPTAATAVRQGADSFAELLARHCSAALPPG
jgi:hypothetical protein